MTRSEARDAIQRQFRKTVDRDVSFLVYDQLIAEGHRQAAALCTHSHKVISERLWANFSFDWSKVFFNPGGTVGKASAFLQAKAELSYVWSLAGGEFNETLRELELALLGDLNALWAEWAGYFLTSSPELAVAIDQP